MAAAPPGWLTPRPEGPSGAVHCGKLGGTAPAGPHATPGLPECVCGRARVGVRALDVMGLHPPGPRDLVVGCGFSKPQRLAPTVRRLPEQLLLHHLGAGSLEHLLPVREAGA